MNITLNNLTTNMILQEIQVNMYREQLLRYIDDYQINLNDKFDEISTKANTKAKIVIARAYDPANLELQKDYKRIESKIGNKTRYIISEYMRRIMFMLGNICECIIIDNCKRDLNLNMKCINYARFKSDINEEYNDIEYNKYTPFSPSHKRIVLYSDAGIIHYQDNNYVYEPNHINKDIIWCNKESKEDILKASIPYTKYELMAKLQVKSSTNFSNIDWNEEKYRFSPIIYFDLNRDINDLHKYLSNKNSNLYVRSVLDFNFRLMEESMWYFRILAGHFSGLIDLRKEINFNMLETMNSGIIKYIFNSDIKSLLSDDSVIKSNELLIGIQDTILGGNQVNHIDISLN
ncbi:hypothetical protein CHL78_000980 [Romboutsia weinsteinii]|uniref:Uncharacterized protein n=1 Tax=Romboutsia weinsteinii TaxID=2020949 RepID=A0A371JAS3_9FIRM|nr:hypothetical protein [Romboutsia weinsteinii]RDY29776.1 hypothetical protein CHL78_000980 [Romboutsia weinsteinii]